jgi:hypothetical protein
MVQTEMDGPAVLRIVIDVAACVVHTQSHACLHTYIRAYVHTHIHTYTHTHTVLRGLCDLRNYQFSDLRRGCPD